MTLLLLVMTAQPAPPQMEAADFIKAIRARDAVKVEAMLADDPALVDARTPDGMSAVSVAMFTFDANGSLTAPHRNEVLQRLLVRGPKLDLHETAAVGRANELQKMLACDAAAVGVRTRLGWTPLHYAAFAGNVPALEILLARGADVDARASNRFRNTPLLVATLTGQYDAIRLLLEKGADVLDRQAEGYSVLHEAAFIGSLELVNLYLDRGAELNSRTDDGRTPLSEALRGGHPAIAEFLRSKGGVAGTTGENAMKAPE